MDRLGGGKQITDKDGLKPGDGGCWVGEITLSVSNKVKKTTAKTDVSQVLIALYVERAERIQRRNGIGLHIVYGCLIRNEFPTEGMRCMTTRSKEVLDVFESFRPDVAGWEAKELSFWKRYRAFVVKPHPEMDLVGQFLIPTQSPLQVSIFRVAIFHIAPELREIDLTGSAIPIRVHALNAYGVLVVESPTAGRLDLLTEKSVLALRQLELEMCCRGLRFSTAFRVEMKNKNEGGSL